MIQKEQLGVLCKGKCLVMAMGVCVGGGQTSSQVPDGAGHCGVSVEFP